MKDDLPFFSHDNDAEFPELKMHRKTLEAIEGTDYIKRYRALRCLSSGFVHRPDVRAYLMRRDGGKCVLCGSKESLTVDHIKMVTHYAHAKKWRGLNAENNLRILCWNCNKGRSQYPVPDLSMEAV